MGHLKGVFHDMLFVVFFDNSAKLSEDLTCFITNIFSLILKKLFKKRENCSTDALVAKLAKVFWYHCNQTNKLTK